MCCWSGEQITGEVKQKTWLVGFAAGVEQHWEVPAQAVQKAKGKIMLMWLVVGFLFNDFLFRQKVLDNC